MRKFSKKDGWLDLSEYKVLGDGEIKNKLKIKALSVSKNAKEKIEKAGGEINLSKNLNLSEKKE